MIPRHGRAAVAAAGCAALVTSGALGLSPSASARAAAPSVIVQVWLKPDIAGATVFADAASTPGRPGFHHYLSPNAYTARFGPSTEHAKAVADWLTGAGMAQVHISSGRDYVSATGSVSTLTPPPSLAPEVLGVTGLGSGGGSATGKPQKPQKPTRAKAPTCSQHWAQHVQSYQPAYQGLTKGSLPICGYSADQIRAAYGATAANTGKGVTIALTEDAPPAAMFTTLTDYAKSNHLPAPRRAQFQLIQNENTCGDLSSHAANAAKAGKALKTAKTAMTAKTAGVNEATNDEAQLDSEAVYAMAPDATQRMVVAAACDQALLDAPLSVLLGDGAHPGATIISNSWQIPLGSEPALITHAMDLRAAAEGVGMYFASGDTPGLTLTASDPYATTVGGSTLGVGAHGERVFETGWSTDSATLAGGAWTDQGTSGGGGGISQDYAQPAYQKGVVPAAMAQARVGGQAAAHRAVPDLAAVADPDTGLLVGYIQDGTDSRPGPYQTAPNAGTSLACPLIAALVADAQQGQPAPFGFLNPLLYELSGTKALHDILPPASATPQQNRDSYFPAAGASSPSLDVFGSPEPGQTLAKGYDTTTGLGTPDGAAFIDGLRKASR